MPPCGFGCSRPPKSEQAAMTVGGTWNADSEREREAQNVGLRPWSLVFRLRVAIDRSLRREIDAISRKRLAAARPVFRLALPSARVNIFPPTPFFMRNSLLPFVITLFNTALFVGAAEPNTLSDAEKRDGWKLLFDGKTTTAWQAIGKSDFPAKGWVVRDGLLVHEARAGGGDIVTREQFTDFELAWEWRIAPAGNSGLKYNLLAPNKGVGCEYQLLDDAKHPDATQHGKTRQTGGLYDVLPPAIENKMRPAGEWNSSRVVVRGTHVEHWLNDAKSVEFDFGSPALKAAVAESKFKTTQEWSAKRTSPILLQDHGDEIAFRNIKIRVLDRR